MQMILKHSPLTYTVESTATDYKKEKDYESNSEAVDSRLIQATVVSMLRGLVLSSILLHILPVFMGGNGIWWAVTLAEALAALVALWYLLPELKGIKTE